MTLSKDRSEANEVIVLFCFAPIFFLISDNAQLATKRHLMFKKRPLDVAVLLCAVGG
jgi:hypothetical protein